MTSGPFSVRRVVGIDETKKNIYFIANAREDGEYPYFLHLYRISIDGSKLRLLNKGNFDHRVNMNESHSYFVNNSSRVNTLPIAQLSRRPFPT